MSATISLKKPMARSSNVALDLIQILLVIAAFLFFVGMTHLFLNKQPSAEVILNFQNIEGSTCGSLLPTGNVKDTIYGVSVTCIDNGMPVVLINAADLGIIGTESPQQLDSNIKLKQQIEAIRLVAGQKMNLGDVSNKTVPKMSIVSPAIRGGAIHTRTFIPHKCHAAIGVFGATSVATACLIEGTVASIPPQGGRKHPNQEFIQVDTTNILFICGGAFDGLDKYILRRTDKSALGFGSSLKDNSSEAEKALLRKVEPHDLVKFGLIPELIGRLPVITVLDDLDEDALVRVLKEPRNSLVKQYKELLGMDNVELTFTDEALHAIARKTIERKTGARGLRSVMESILLPIMYEVPSDATIIRVTVDEDTVEGGEAHLEYGAVRKRYKNQAALS